MCRHFGIHHSDMDPTQIGNFYPCNLKQSERKIQTHKIIYFDCEIFCGASEAQVIKPNIKYDVVTILVCKWILSTLVHKTRRREQETMKLNRINEKNRNCKRPLGKGDVSLILNGEARRALIVECVYLVW